MTNIRNVSQGTIFVISAGLAAALTSACIADGEDAGLDGLNGLTAATTGGASGPGAEEAAEGSSGGPESAVPGASDIGVHETTKGACAPNVKEYFAVRAGLVGHSMAIDVEGNVYAWGANDRGQLGNGTVSTLQTKPTKIAGSQKFWDVAGGDKHTLGLAEDGTVWGWGDNSAGQIVNATTSIPKKIAGLGGVVQIAAGGRFSLALTAEGKLYAWGDNTYGQLGIGSVGGIKATPTLVTGVTSPVSIAAGRDFAAAHKGTQLWIWGRDNVGQLGNGSASAASRGTPSLVALSGIYQFDLGAEHVIVHTSSNGSSDFYAWGANAWGQLGDGTLSTRTAPTPIIGPDFMYVGPIVAGVTSSFITGASGFAPPKPGLELSSAGRNDLRQLLRTAANPDKSFAAMSGVLQEGWVNGVNHGYLQQLAAGNGYTLVLVGTTVKAIGANSTGLLGDGTQVGRSSPTNVCLP